MTQQSFTKMNRIPLKTPSDSRIHTPRLTILVFLIVCLSGVHALKAQDRQPNIIFILADDLGYGDVSAYGQKHFKTPNIDKLAREGMMFTNHYSGSPVCAPSRSALMTGLHSGHTYIRGNKEVRPEGQWPLASEAFTLTEMMKSAGFTTGVFGKWGLGYPGSEGDPTRQGVDRFYGYNCQRLAHNYYPGHLWNNTEKVVLSGNTGAAKKEYAPELIHQEALKFLDENRDKPFFLFYPMVIPHAELAAPERYMDKFRGKYLPEKSYDGADEDEPGFRQGAYASQKETHAAFAAMINIMDEQVGDIVNKVSSLGLDENTIIIFSSDNGPHVEGGADPDYFDSNGPLRGYKRDVYEGGIRVPMIVRWKGVVKEGSRTDHVSAFWDLMPTLADLLKVNLAEKGDGISFLPTLTGKSRAQEQHQYLYWEFHELGGRRALRTGDWKLVQYNVGKDTPGSFELYNLKNDPGENNNLATKYPKRVEEMVKLMLSAHLPSEDFPFASEKK